MFRKLDGFGELYSSIRYRGKKMLCKWISVAVPICKNEGRYTKLHQ